MWPENCHRRLGIVTPGMPLRPSEPNTRPPPAGLNLVVFSHMFSDRGKKPKLLSLDTVFEMWLLSFLFVVVIAGLLQLQNHQVLEQSEVAQSMETEKPDTFTDISRNNTPALGY